jgi:hypothetical protein
MEKKTLIGMVLLVMMLLSTFTYSFIGGFRTGSTEIPTGNIVKYQLSPEQESKLVQQGKTIVTFTYTKDCNNCQEALNFLEQVATGYKDQVFLVEKEGNSTSILVKSMNGQRITGSITEERITSLLCDLMVQPPSTCVLGKL